jgi:aminoglycoside phosphotransferase (APT) family kinase protein
MALWDPEITIDRARAQALIESRFPELDASELTLLGRGWDNTVWVTRDRIAFRFPRRAIAVPGVEREIALLPSLTDRLPVSVPDPAYVADPSEEFPWPWFGSRMIAGRELAEAQLDEESRLALATQTGRFLRALHDLELPAAEQLPIDPIGRVDMAVRVPKTRAALDAVAPLWTAPPMLAELLAHAEELPQPGAPTLVHGDFHLRHMLVGDGGALAGVIDWGDICRAEPSIDLSPVWSEFGPAARAAFFSRYGDVDPAQLLRARVIALFLCATLATYAEAEQMPELRAATLLGLDRTLID